MAQPQPEPVVSCGARIEPERFPARAAQSKNSRSDDHVGSTFRPQSGKEVANTIFL
jgi:hypothetical protein